MHRVAPIPEPVGSNLGSSRVLSIPEDQRGYLLGGFRLQRRNDMRIEVQSDANAAVSQPVRHGLRVNACQESETGVCVPEAVRAADVGKV